MRIKDRRDGERRRCVCPEYSSEDQRSGLERRSGKERRKPASLSEVMEGADATALEGLMNADDQFLNSLDQ